MYMDIVDSKPVAQEERWEVGPPVVSQGVIQREVLRTGIDRFAGGYICTTVKKDAERIVTEHNQYLALTAERDQLRESVRLLGARLEQLASEKAELAGENERMRDALNRQKGEST